MVKEGSMVLNQVKAKKTNKQTTTTTTTKKYAVRG